MTGPKLGKVTICERLITLFASRGFANAEELADDALIELLQESPILSVCGNCMVKTITAEAQRNAGLN
jgi:hypothetical protein